MEYKNLGRSVLKISRIGFGCMSLKKNNDPERLIHRAIDQGINFFDTADLYDKGDNEALLGKAIRQKRNSVILSTKGGNQWNDDGSGWIWNPKGEYLTDAVEKSLKRLGTDYIDLYQLHGGTIQDPIEEIVATFESLIQQGKIRCYGISSIRPNVIDSWIKLSNMASVMMQYSLLDRRPEETCFPSLLANQIGVLARGSLAQGVLLGKATQQYLNRSPVEVAEAVREVQHMNEVGPPGGIALSYVLQHPAVTSAIIGIRNMDQLDAALHALQFYPLPVASYQALQEKIPTNFYKEHRLTITE